MQTWRSWRCGTSGASRVRPSSLVDRFVLLIVRRRRCGLYAVLDVDTHLEGFELPKGERLDRYNLTLENWEPDSDFDPDEEEEEEDGDLVVIGREPPESQKRSCEYPPASLAADMARASIRDEEKDIDEEGEYRMVVVPKDERPY